MKAYVRILQTCQLTQQSAPLKPAKTYPTIELQRTLTTQYFYFRLLPSDLCMHLSAFPLPPVQMEVHLQDTIRAIRSLHGPRPVKAIREDVPQTKHYKGLE